MNILFAGTADFAVPSLQALHQSEHHVLAVWTQPDRQAGRGQHIKMNSVKRYALDHQLPIYQPETLTASKTVDIMSVYQPDVLVVAAYGLLLPTKILQLPIYGGLNVHASLLPRWRGASPVQQALLANDLYTGISIMQMVQALDAGPIWRQSIVPINTNMTALDLTEQLAHVGAEALLNTLVDLKSNRQPVPQTEAFATYAPKIKKIDAQLDWTQPAYKLAQIVKAYQPWPVAFTQLQHQRLRIAQAVALDSSVDAPPGTILNLSAAGLEVATGAGILKLLQCQLPGTKWLTIDAICRGYRSLFNVGQCFQSV